MTKMIEREVRRRPFRLAGALVLAGVIAYLISTAFAGPAGATKQRAHAATPVSTYVNVNGTEFNVDNSDVTCGFANYDYADYSGALYDHSGCTYEAGFNLPDGMRIINITAFYRPRSNGGEAYFHFEASNDTGGHVDMFDDEPLPDCGSTYCSVTYTHARPYPVVTNATTHYGLFLPVVTGPFELYRFRIGLAGGGGSLAVNGTPTGTLGTNGKG